MNIEIKHRFTNNVLFECEAENMREAILNAVKNSAYLRGADLVGADLVGADLGGAYLRGTDLVGADLGGAYLRGADLVGADLGGAYLVGADLGGADLGGADLGGADLRGADLGGADLGGADLGGEKLAIAPISILNLNWEILISEQYLKIGCQRHTHEEWINFSDEDIKEMESRASIFWNINKIWILAACEAHKSESLAYRAANPEKFAA